MTGNTINDDMTMGGPNGALLAGRYRVVRQLGQGGMGSVWLAEDTKLDGFKVAIKMLPSVLVNNKRAYAQVKAEALVSLKLSHPNIATVRAFEEEGGNPFLVMDYIDGQTLDDYLAEKGKLSEDEAIRLLKPVAAALDYAHTQGVVHRDVKPGNVMIRKDGTPFVLDFGIAREIQETMTRVTGKLSSGTLLYMSPEQLHGAAPKPSQDIYSFAAMVYECLKGEPPFSRGQIEYQIEHDTPTPLDEHIAICSQVMAGLAKSPETRPMSCALLFEKTMQGRTEVVRRSKCSVNWLWVVLCLGLCLAGAGLWHFELGRGLVERESVDVESVQQTGQYCISTPKIIGVMTSLEGVVGDNAWHAFASLAKDYVVRSVATDSLEIDEDIETLVVLHAKGLEDRTLYAIDQFVLRGGRLVVCVDPFNIVDMIASRRMQSQNPMCRNEDGPSTLGALFNAWGVGFDVSRITCDLSAATRLNNGQGGVDDNPAFLSLGKSNMNLECLGVSQIGQVMFPFAGAFTYEEINSDLAFIPIITTSRDNSCSADKGSVQVGAIKNMVPDGSSRVIVAQLNGMFKTAFPDRSNSASSFSKSRICGKGCVVLFADADFIADDFCFRKTDIRLDPINDNLKLFSLALGIQNSGLLLYKKPSNAPIGGNISAPKPVEPIRPNYPKGARARGEEGKVTLAIDVSDTGDVVAVRIQGSSGFAELDEAAVQSVKQSKFIPAIQNGEHVKSTCRLALDFKLK